MNILDIINPIKVCVLVTLLFALFSLQWKNRMHCYVKAILLVAFLTELVSSILVYNGLPLRVTYNISIFFHDTLWLLAFMDNAKRNKIAKVMLSLFCAFAIINFTVMELMDAYNYYTFVLGALLYVTVFIQESYLQLRDENLRYFLSNNYLLLSAPLFFFFGMGLMMGFKPLQVSTIIIFGNVTLYFFIVNIVCIAYYSLINIYIYREKSNY